MKNFALMMLLVFIFCDFSAWVFLNSVQTPSEVRNYLDYGFAFSLGAIISYLVYIKESFWN